MRTTIWDVAVVGAGMAGLVCGRSLQAAGYRVLVLEKSKGFGGRIATRRLHDTRADHGTPYLTTEDSLADLIDTLTEQGCLHPWPRQHYRLSATGELTIAPAPKVAIAPSGINSVGKFLAEGLTVYRQQRVVALAPTEHQTWQLSCDGPQSAELLGDQSLELEARAVILAIPAPQALPLIHTVSPASAALDHLAAALDTVVYDPCLTVMAGYRRDRPAPPGKNPDENIDGGWTIKSIEHPTLRWIGLDSSKRTVSASSAAGPSVVVIHSSPAFAAQNFDAPNLHLIGAELVSAAAESVPALANPDWAQVHRWRYAFAQQPYTHTRPYLISTEPLPLFCCGDWCQGATVGAALQSGLATADAFKRHINISNRQ